MGGYGQPPVSAPTERYPQLSRLLQTEEGFTRSVIYAGGVAKAIPSLLVLAVVALVYNIIITLQSMGKYDVPKDYFFDVFFSVTGTNGNTDPWLVFWVYAPVVLIPLLIILWIVRKVTYGSSISKVRDAYMRAGFVADLVPTGLPAAMGNRRGVVFVFGAPNVPPDAAMMAAQRIAGIASNDPKSRETKAYVAAIGKLAAVGLGDQATQISQADPAIMPGIFATAQMSLNDNRPRVAIPIGNDFTKLHLYRLKKDVPIA